MAAPFTHFRYADCETDYVNESGSRQSLSKQIQYNRNETDGGMKTKKWIYHSWRLRNVRKNPGKSVKVNIRMDAENEIHPTARLKVTRLIQKTPLTWKETWAPGKELTFLNFHIRAKFSREEKYFPEKPILS